MDDGYDLRVVMRITGSADGQVVVSADDAILHRHDAGSRHVTFVVDDGDYGLASVTLELKHEGWVFSSTMLLEHKQGRCVLPMMVELNDEGTGLCCSFPMYDKECKGLLVDGNDVVEFLFGDLPKSRALN